MTSRKRNKGKERKAKKFEAEQVAKRVKARTTWQYWARGEMGLNVGGNCIIQSIECNHGCNVTIPDENNHPVCGFMDLYFMHCLGNSNKNMRSLLMHFSLQEMESRCNSNNVSLNITISSVRFLGWGWMAMVVAINFFLRLGWIMAMVVANFLLRQGCMQVRSTPVPSLLPSTTHTTMMKGYQSW